MVSSTVVPQVQAVFQPGALTKKIKVGLQVTNPFKRRKERAAAKQQAPPLVPKKRRLCRIW